MKNMGKKPKNFSIRAIFNQFVEEGSLPQYKRKDPDLTKGPPKSYFEREPRFTSADAITRVASNRKVGLYEGNYVNLNTRKYITEKQADRIISRVVKDAADNPALTFEATNPGLVGCCNHD